VHVFSISHLGFFFSFFTSLYFFFLVQGVTALLFSKYAALRACCRKIYFLARRVLSRISVLTSIFSAKIREHPVGVILYPTRVFSHVIITCLTKLKLCNACDNHMFLCLQKVLCRCSIFTTCGWSI